MKSVVTVGGGTGQFALLSGLKQYPVQLSSIVSMADDGGSTGILRDELGVLPPGDIRQCLVALSESDLIMRELFNYRFESGRMSGHNFGNIFLSTLEKITGSFEESVRVAGMVLAIRGQVIPVTTSDIALVSGEKKVLAGEDAINTAPLLEPKTLRLEPQAYANPKAVTAIERADCIIIGPGNLFCSIVPNLLIKGIPEAISRSRASVVFNCNLMTKAGHTDGFSVMDFVGTIERYIGKGRIDFVTYNRRSPKQELLERYAEDGEYPVSTELGDDSKRTFEPLADDLISSRVYIQKQGDLLKRTLIRHDPARLAGLIIQNCLKGI